MVSSKRNAAARKALKFISANRLPENKRSCWTGICDRQSRESHRRELNGLRSERASTPEVLLQVHGDLALEVRTLVASFRLDPRMRENLLGGVAALRVHHQESLYEVLGGCE